MPESLFNIIKNVAYAVYVPFPAGAGRVNIAVQEPATRVSGIILLIYKIMIISDN